MTLFIGLMSGTSVDAIDVVLVDFVDEKSQLIATYTHLWPVMIREQLLKLSQHPDEKYSLYELAQLETQIGEIFAEAVLALLAQQHISNKEISAIGSPGQTLLHAPQAFYTWQLGDPNIIAERTGIITVSDFRRRDMAAGGQGAPLAPSFHRAFLHSVTERRVVLNIGGIANISVLPADPNSPVIGFDTGPGNALLDAWSMQQRGLSMDSEGEWAASGMVQTDLLTALLTDPYFRQLPPKSTGRDYFNLNWLMRYLLDKQSLLVEDVQATLCQLTISTVTQAILPYRPDRLLVCGGGVYNLVLMNGLRQTLPECIVESTLQQGIHPDWVEAMCFAWLAKQRLAVEVGNLPSVTGAKCAVVLGGIYY